MNNFPTNFLKSITFLHPMGVCGWTFHRTDLNHALSEDGTMKRDAHEKRAQFIDSSVKIRESFNFAHPIEQLNAIEKYWPVRQAARDVQSSVGSNLALIRKESGGVDPWTSSPGQLKAALLKAEIVPVPAEDAWRIPYLRRLLTERTTHFYNGDTHEEERVQSLIDSLVVR